MTTLLVVCQEITHSLSVRLRWAAFDFWHLIWNISRNLNNFNNSFAILFHARTYFYPFREISNREFLSRVEDFLLSQVFTHDCFHLGLCRGRRWTRKMTDGDGGRQEWVAVGGWPVRPYRQTPNAPFPPSPTCQCGRLCHVLHAHPDRQKQIKSFSVFTCTQQTRLRRK